MKFELFGKLLAALGTAIAVSLPAHAVTIVGPFGPGTSPISMGDLTDKVGIFANTHPGQDASFVDVFLFGVSTPSLGVGTILLPSPALPLDTNDLATIQALVLVTLEGTPLAADVDGSDGFTVTSLLPAAGIYGLVAVGQSGGGQGVYLGALGTVPLPVPEPTSALLFASGLLGIAWLGRRRFN